MRWGWVIVSGVVLSGLIVAITLALTKVEVVEVLPIDSAGAEKIAGDLQAELDRLYFRYNDRLEILADSSHRYSRSLFTVEGKAREMVGVRTISWLDYSDSGQSNHLEIQDLGDRERLDSKRFPQLTSEGIQGEGENVLSLSAAYFHSGTSDSGWMRRPLDVVYYWKRVRNENFIVVGIDSREVQGVVSDWLLSQDEPELRPLGESRTALVHGAGEVLWESHEAAPSPVVPISFPVANRLGRWQFLVWPESRRSYQWNVPFLISGVALAVCVLIASVSAAMALLRATRIAEQRVTFVNRVSHELRTPITNILLNTDLARELIEADPEDACSRLDRIRIETARLSRLVDNVLTFSRREKGAARLTSEVIGMREILFEVLANFEELLQSAAIQVRNEVSSELLVRGDRDALVQIINNLVSNVEKYGKSGGELSLSSREKEGFGSLVVKDRGPGIDAKVRDRIFEPFRRSGDAINEGVSGTGLGLTIARDLAREMGGDLKVIDSDTGAAFELLLPLVEP